MTARLSNPAAAKDPRRTWYGLALWKTRRAHQLRIEPLCAICKAEGRITGATIADLRRRKPTDEAALTERQAKAHLAAVYRRQIAAIERRLKALEDRALVDDILNATLRAPEVS